MNKESLMKFDSKSYRVESDSQNSQSQKNELNLKLCCITLVYLHLTKTWECVSIKSLLQKKKNLS